MTNFYINPDNNTNKQNINAYYNQFRAIQPTGITPENRPNIRYNKSLFDQNKDYSTYNTNITENNNARSITTDWTAQSIRNFKYNILLNEFAPGYPLNYTYNLCDQKLSSVFSIGSYTHYSIDQSVSTNYPKNHSLSVIQNNINNPFLCSVPPTGNCQNTVCLPGQTFDPLTCLCTTPEECVPQDSCEPTVVYSNIKPKIYGYAFYLESVQEVNIPDIGNVKASCGGGHVCCGTLFRPTLVFLNNSTLSANRNICMDNFSTCKNDGSQIPVPGFVRSAYYERSDTFEFVLDNPSSLSNARLELVCQYGGCHSGVTFVVLVGETADTNTKVVLFSSCVAPGSVNSKVIGTIDCDNEPVPCEPPPTPTPTPTPVPPTPSSTPPATPTPTPPVTPTPTPTSTECLVCPPGNVPGYLIPYQLVDAGDGTKRCCGVGFVFDGTECVSEDENSESEHPAVLPQPCCTETECRSYTYDSNMDDETGDFSTFAIGSCTKSNTTIVPLGSVDGQETWRYTTLVTITCDCRDSFEAATGPLRGPDSTNPGSPISYEIVSCSPTSLCYQASCYGCGDIDCCNADPGSCPPQCNGLCGVDCEYSNQPCLIQSFATLQEASDYMDATCYGLNGTVINTCNG